MEFSDRISQVIWRKWEKQNHFIHGALVLSASRVTSGEGRILLQYKQYRGNRNTLSGF